MVETPSTMTPLGTPAPDFELPAVRTGETVTLASFAGRPAFLAMFICNHCPFVQHVAAELVKLGLDYADRGVGIVAINANDVQAYPDDSPSKMAELANEWGFTFFYCFDESQEVAKAYGAACTPDFFLYDGDRELVYRGQLDGARPGNDEVNDGADLRAALDAVLEDRPIPSEQKASMGCNIKWRPGNEPD